MIKKLNFWHKLPRPFTVLAPMEDVTNFAFRETVATLLPRPDVFFTEFTNTDALTSVGLKKTIHRFKFSNNQKPIIAQLWGTNPENFEKSAKIAYDFGFDGIDINMGCPVKAVVKIGACSALIKNRALVKEIIEATKKGANKLPVSVKTRIGFKDVETEEWITYLLEQKLDAVTVHGRTARQMSDVPANWEEIKKAVNLKNSISPETVIIGNGDCKNYNDVVQKHEQYGVDGVMIGRGIFANPWVFEKITKKHSFDESKKILIKHLELLDNTSHYDKIKKFYKMYVNNFDGAGKLRAELMSTKAVEEALQILK
jgi:nifR3 family TIM-barrel protein